MENKYNEIDKLNQLKENRTITETEYEVEKYKILNSKSNTTQIKISKSKIFFILTGVSVFVTVIFGFSFYMWRSKSYFEIMSLLNSNRVLFNLMSYIISYGVVVLGIVNILMLVLGIIFKVKEKGGIKIVN
jgi:hypothetical protein